MLNQKTTKSEFFIHLAVYIGVNILLMILNLKLSPGYYWAKWPHMGWGIGLILSALKVFIFPGKSLTGESEG